MKSPILYILSGLPASGKSTLAQALAKQVNATYLRIDTIEQGLADVCRYKIQAGESYEMSHLIASDNLRLGNSVVADSVNPWEFTRKDWNQVAIRNQAQFVNIEVVCSDPEEHRNRAENRAQEVKGLKPPTWEEILKRDYESWTEQRLRIDTAGKEVSESIVELFEKLKVS